MQPNAKKLAEHQRKKDRKTAEKQLEEKKERIKKAQEARAEAAKHAADNPQVTTPHLAPEMLLIFGGERCVLLIWGESKISPHQAVLRGLPGAE